MSKGSRLDASTSVEESIGAKGATEVDKENIQDLLGPQGALQNGLVPALRVDGKDGVKSIINDISNMSGEGRQCKKPNKKPQPEPAEPVGPTKPIELAKAGLATVRERLVALRKESSCGSVSFRPVKLVSLEQCFPVRQRWPTFAKRSWRSGATRWP